LDKIDSVQVNLVPAAFRQKLDYRSSVPDIETAQQNTKAMNSLITAHIFRVKRFIDALLRRSGVEQNGPRRIVRAAFILNFGLSITLHI